MGASRALEGPKGGVRSEGEEGSPLELGYVWILRPLFGTESPCWIYSTVADLALWNAPGQAAADDVAVCIAAGCQRTM